MASPKALAAIALTLIIAVPICLGYGLASENVPYNEWQTESSVNLSNSILNHSTPIFMDYTDTGNNSMVISGTPARLSPPTYNQVSSTYSSLPIYTTASGSMPWTRMVTQSYTLTPGFGNTHILALNHHTANSYQLSNDGAIYMTASASGTLLLYGGDLTSKYFNAPAQILAIQAGDNDYYEIWVNGTKLSGLYSGFMTDATTSQTWTVYSNASNSLLQPSERNYAVNFPSALQTSPFDQVSLKIVSEGVTHWLSGHVEEIIRMGGNMDIDGTLYMNVTEAKLAMPLYDINSVGYTYSAPGTTYAEPSYGWNVGTGAKWTNGFVNEYVRFMVTVEDGETCSFQANYTDGTTSTLVTLANTSGTATVNGDTLGAYTYLMVELRPESTTVTGLQGGWPAMGTEPIRYNSITVDNSTTGNIYTVSLTASGSSVEFRVDAARILSGTFPSTYNYTLSMNDLYPDKSYTLKLNSIGIYGDTFSVGSSSYTVSNGRITVDGATVPLKGTTVSSKYNGTTYDIYLGGHHLGTSATPASITFGGEWSLTVTAQILKQVNGEKAEWAPGSFAFDEDSFKGVIVLAAAVAFIGVGMYGARSGVKVGLLLMICGGAALIAMITL